MPSVFSLTLYSRGSGDSLHYEKFADGSVKCIEDEIPFELPEGWEWCRLGDITSLVTDYVANGSFATLKENVRTYKGKNYALFVRTVDFANNFEKDLSYIDKESYDFLEKSKLFGGELMLSNIGASIGKVFKIPHFDMPMSLAPNSIVLKFFDSDTSDYFEVVFKSFVGQDYLKNLTAGTAMPKFNKTELKAMIVPFPPLHEQRQVVDASAIFLNYIKIIETNRDTTNIFVKQAKAKILDLAIQGKLVPQDPNDEPASVLLERIRAEKEELIKQGKIKRDKKESVIFKGEDNSYYEKVDSEVRCIDSELPFEVPESWIFVRLKHVGEIVGGGTPKTSIREYWDGNIPWLTPADFSGYEGMYISGGTRNITELGLKSSSAQMLPANSVLYSSRAPIGYIAIATNSVSTNQGFKSVVPYDFTMSTYLYYCLKARTDNIVQRATGTTFKEISSSEMAETIIPLPPLNEQKRIFEKVTQLLEVIATIEKSLN